MEDLQFRIAKLQPQAGDVIVLRTDMHLTVVQRETIQRFGESAFADFPCKVIVLQAGLSIELVRQVQGSATEMAGTWSDTHREALRTVETMINAGEVEIAPDPYRGGLLSFFRPKRKRRSEADSE